MKSRKYSYISEQVVFLLALLMMTSHLHGEKKLIFENGRLVEVEFDYLAPEECEDDLTSVAPTPRKVISIKPHDGKSLTFKPSNESSDSKKTTVISIKPEKPAESEKPKLASYEQEKFDRIQSTVDLAKRNPVVGENFNFLRLKTIIRDHSTVLLAVGAPGVDLTENERGLATDVIKRLLDKKLLILYDADSDAAPWIRQMAGDSAIGITGTQDLGAKQTDGVVSITNPYDRLYLFTKVNEIVATQSSLIGLASILMDEKSVYLLNPNQNMVDQFSDWFASLKKYSFGPNRVSAPSIKRVHQPTDYLTPWTGSRTWAGKRWIPLTDLKAEDIPLWEYMADDLKAAVHRDDLVETVHEELKNVPQGLVFFGAGAKAPEFESFVYATMYAAASKGVPVFTGGAGGLMRAANKAAFAAGGESIGIPLGDGFRIDSENVDSREYQSRTVRAGDYHVRIPALLDHRPLVVFGPGGRGTMKELATTLVALNTEAEDSNKTLVFLTSDFYGGLADYLTSPMYPIFLRSRVGLVDKPHQMNEVIDHLDKHLGDASVGYLKTHYVPTPRKLPKKQNTKQKDAKKASGKEGTPATPIAGKPSQVLGRPVFGDNLFGDGSGFYLPIDYDWQKQYDDGEDN